MRPTPHGSAALAAAHLPHAGPGQRIGLLGGSFDPPHEGHLHISLEALKRFRLDAVWWLVSPGNPLKANGPAPLDRRMRAAASLATHPRLRLTDIEAHIGTRYTEQTLRWLCKVRPQVRFVWLMGADNLAQFHLWDNWETIVRTVPIGVLARPMHRLPARTSVAAARFAEARLPASASARLAQSAPPAWCFVNVPLRAISSTALRATGAWTSQGLGQGKDQG